MSGLVQQNQIWPNCFILAIKVHEKLVFDRVTTQVDCYGLEQKMTHVLALIESYQEQLSEEIKRSEKLNRKMRFSLLCSAENTKQSKPVALKYHTNPT